MRVHFSLSDRTTETLRREVIPGDLTPVVINKFRGLAAAALSLVFALPVAAQVGDLSSYQGPGIMSPGVGNVGQRGGQQVELRVFGGVSGFYDTNPQATVVDSNGNLLKASDLYGVQLDFGAYGSHDFRASKLSLDYHGDYRHATVASYDSTDHSLTLGYTLQVSRRVVLDLRGSVGSLKTGFGGVADTATSASTDALSPSALFFDTRTYYAQSTAAVTFLTSARTSVTVNGSGFLRDYTSGGLGLANTYGYALGGSVNRRLSKDTTIGVSYQRSYFETSGLGSQSTSNAYLGTLAATLGRLWTFNLQAGVTDVSVANSFSITLSPLAAAILGQSSLTGVASARHYYPSGSAELRRTFQRASVSFRYERKINSGNGLFTTLRTENAGASLNYTAIRKVSLSVYGNYNNSISLDAVGERYRQIDAAIGGSYNLGHDLHITARVGYRDQNVPNGTYSLRGSQSSLGLTFSPGRSPLAIW